MKQPCYDVNKRLVCPNCHKSESVFLEWSDSDNIHGEHEDVFMCDSCKCVFIAIYKIEGIEIIGEEKKND